MVLSRRDWIGIASWGMAGLLAETSLAGEQRSYVEAIHTSGAALASLWDAGA